MRKIAAPPLPAAEMAAKHLRALGHASFADELFKERAAVVELLKCGADWLHASDGESRTALKRALAKLGVTA